MDDLLHKLVSGVITGGLIALAGCLGAQRRKRKSAQARTAEVDDPRSR
ncbi:hypothetical protein ACFOSC_04325 [Streptantibioticus rubrisoli]|uniref:Lipoprotein n=1 Tax=Streptantibioticus rubrisoli TaxID=1387313 RepID=A0ABT1PMV4_9ACTN|nr:hypothetical protein [Streptantibioticus rubrisoli]MCQ4046692.1 hypothetical protein [Streptantibioticus rubrisoli]